jgi:hypothetical protein
VKVHLTLTRLTTMMVFLAAPALAAESIPLDEARRIFEDVRIGSEQDAGKLWGKELWGPILLVDAQTRQVVANRADEGGVLKPAASAEGRIPLFTGTLPSEVVIANTAVRWGGVHWTMVMWQSISAVTVARRRLVLHECFHRIQDELGFPAANANAAYLDNIEGRYWYLLELRALGAALRAQDRAQAVSDALAFRNKRRALFPEAAAAERALEANEGLAEYTGFALRGTGAEETRQSMSRLLQSPDRESSFVRSFAYSTGPAYGLLLDIAKPDWRSTFKPENDLADVLAFAMRVSASEDPAARANEYHGVALRKAEEKRAKKQAEIVARYRARLVDGPLIEIPLDGASFGFDPYTVVPLGDAGTVYPKLEVTGAWGKITTESGARMDPARAALLFSVEDRAKLELSAGWTLVPGAREGDLVLKPEGR